MTPFTNIYDRSLVVIQDYKLDNLAKSNYSAFLTFMKGLLTSGVDLFNGCLIDLSWEDIEEDTDVQQVDENGDPVIDDEGNPVYVKEINTYFVNDLSSKEQSILAMIVVYKWYERELNDVREFKLHLQGRAFRSYSESQLFSRRTEQYNILRENISREINNYQISNLDRIVEV